MTSVLWQFDCLNNHVDLNTLCEDSNLKTGMYVDEWFNVPHISHERSEEESEEEAVDTLFSDGEDIASESKNESVPSIVRSTGKQAAKRGRNDEEEEKEVKAVRGKADASKTKDGGGPVKRARFQVNSRSNATRVAVPTKPTKSISETQSKLASIQPQVPTQESCARDALEARSKLAAKKERQKKDEKTAKEKAQLTRRTQRAASKTKSNAVRHSVKDVRRWEKTSGKLYSSLPGEEREQADAEISELLTK